MAQPTPEFWQDYLDPGEVILWQGRPQPGWAWRAGENGTILLGLFIIGFLGFATYDHIMMGEVGSIGGLLVWVVIALLIGASGPLGMALVRGATWYTLTDRRAVIAHWPMIGPYTLYRGLDCYPITEVALVPADLPTYQTVQFGYLTQRYTFEHGVGWRRRAGFATHEGANAISRREAKMGFERIADGAHVAELCREVHRKRRGALPDNLRPQG